jgi:hypothetical protein
VSFYLSAAAGAQLPVRSFVAVCSLAAAAILLIIQYKQNIKKYFVIHGKCAKRS